MEGSIIEEKREKLNSDIRQLLEVIDYIDGNKRDYENYLLNPMDENNFLDQQIKLVNEAKERLINIFKE